MESEFHFGDFYARHYLDIRNDCVLRVVYRLRPFL
jgi:hypothetical protein